MGTAVEKNLDLRDIKYQIIGGKLITNMAPLANPNHGIISYEISRMFGNYFKGKKCKVYHDNNYLLLRIIEKNKNIKLPDECKKDKYIPDVMVVCDRSIDTIDGVIGAPSLVVEVLSKATMDYDIKIKKEVYALIGVREYWIVNPFVKSIEIYVLENGVYYSHSTYYKYEEREIRAIEEEKEYIRTSGIEIITEFSPYSFPDLIISVDDVFDDLIE